MSQKKKKWPFACPLLISAAASRWLPLHSIRVDSDSRATEKCRPLQTIKEIKSSAIGGPNKEPFHFVHCPYFRNPLFGISPLHSPLLSPLSRVLWYRIAFAAVLLILSGPYLSSSLPHPPVQLVACLNHITHCCRRRRRDGNGLGDGAQVPTSVQIKVAGKLAIQVDGP